MAKTKNKAAFTFTPDEIADVRATIEALRGKLTNLVAISPQQRRTMLKLGKGSIEFVQTIRRVVEEHRDLAPPAVDVARFLEVVSLFETLAEFEGPLVRLAESINDTRMIAGSEAMDTALILYGVLKPVSRTVPGLDVVIKNLKGSRFKKTRARAEGEPAASPAEVGV